MIFGIQDLMLDASFFQLQAQAFGNVNRNCTDQDRLPLIMKFYYFIYACFIFLFFGLVDNIRVISPDHGLICWNNYNVKGIYFFELGCFSVCRSCHSGQLVVHSKIILKGDRGKGLVFVFYLNVLFGFQSLMQPFTVTSSRHQAACKLIHYDNLSILDNIVNIPFKKSMGF